MSLSNTRPPRSAAAQARTQDIVGAAREHGREESMDI